jgi:cell division protein ZapA (FtsZ GTPase activity inhibitor)
MAKQRKGTPEAVVQNYFNYFTEIEEHFQRRRGSLLLLSTIDWALIETWREAGIPLAAVLQGIDAAFDKYDDRKNKARVRRVNGLAYCAQAVMSAVEAMQEAAVGAAPAKPGAAEQGFEQERIAAHLETAAQQLRVAGHAETADRLQALAHEVRSKMPQLEELEQSLTVLEQKLFAVVLTTTPEAELLTLRHQAAAELAPYRSRMPAMQIRLVEQQFLHKRLLEKLNLPRLSLFYMSQA